MSDNERFDWPKFFSGFVNPLNFAKAIVMLFQGGLFILIILAFVFSGFWLKSRFFKPARSAAPVSIGCITGGEVHNSNDEVKKKYGINIF